MKNWEAFAEDQPEGRSRRRTAPKGHGASWGDGIEDKIRFGGGGGAVEGHDLVQTGKKMRVEGYVKLKKRALQ